LPNVLAMNISALRERSPDHPVLVRYATIAKLLSGDPAAPPEASIKWVHNFNSYANIKRLSSFGLVESQFRDIIDKSVKSSSMKGNPITLTEAELRNILQMSI
jgi:alcohol dehydrogenase class IV